MTEKDKNLSVVPFSQKKKNQKEDIAKEIIKAVEDVLEDAKENLETENPYTACYIVLVDSEGGHLDRTIVSWNNLANTLAMLQKTSHRIIKIIAEAEQIDTL